MGRKVLIHAIVFSPDGVSTAYLYNDIALRLKKEGFDVVVLTTTPHYNPDETALKRQPLRRRWGGLYYESHFHGIPVKHVRQKKYRKTMWRIGSFVYWHVMSFLIGLCQSNIHVILSPSPPLTIGLVNILLGKLKGAKTIYNVQEIYPDILLRKGWLKTGSFAVGILRKIEKYVYDRSDAVTTIDELFAGKIADRFAFPEKLHVIPNFVDTDIYKPVPDYEQHIDRTVFPKSDALKLMYAGNIGHAQDWTPLLELAVRVRNKNIDFFIIGDGAMKDHVATYIRENKLERVHLIPYQPRERIPALIAYADLQFICMAPQIDGDGFPSKVYTIMACERPLLVCSGPDTPIVNFLKDKHCAYLITEREETGKIEALENLLLHADKTKLREMGKNGFAFVRTRYSKEAVTTQYVNLIKSLETV